MTREEIANILKSALVTGKIMSQDKADDLSKDSLLYVVHVLETMEIVKPEDDPNAKK